MIIKIILISAFGLLPSGDQFYTEPSKSQNHLFIGAQVLSGVGTGVLATAILFRVFPVVEVRGDVARINAGLMFFNTTAGLVLGSSAGTILAGKILKIHGSPEKTFIGATIGFIGGSLAFVLLSETLKGKPYENVSFIPLFVFPAIGGVVGYHYGPKPNRF